MTRESSKQVLREALRIWTAKPYERLLSELSAGPVAYDCGTTASSGQVEALLLERTPEYVHVCLSVSDSGWRSFVPASTSFLVYRDGKVDCPVI